MRASAGAFAAGIAGGGGRSPTVPAASQRQPRTTPARLAPQRRWPLYATEAALVACLMLSACAFAALFRHPESPVADAVRGDVERRVLLGLAGAITVVTLIYSPLGRRTGPHLNPAMTLTFLRLGRISPSDAAGFVVGQFAGAAIGAGAAAAILGRWTRQTAFAAAVPGAYPTAAVWSTEFAVALVLGVVVFTLNRTRLVRYTGCFAAAATWLLVVLAAPVSGAGLNAARTLAASTFAHVWIGWWVYFTAPPLGMLAAVELLAILGRGRAAMCGKLAHHPTSFFRCNCLESARLAPAPTARDNARAVTPPSSAG